MIPLVDKDWKFIGYYKGPFSLYPETSRRTFEIFPEEVSKEIFEHPMNMGMKDQVRILKIEFCLFEIRNHPEIAGQRIVRLLDEVDENLADFKQIILVEL